MTHTVKQRVVIALVATIAAMLAGLLGGYLLGRMATISLTQHRLEAQVDQAAREADHYLAESQLVLAALRGSPYPPCDVRELTYFRALLFESKHLKDAGRMTGDKIACSAALGTLESPRPVPKPDFLLRDGTRIFKNLPPYQDEDAAVIALQAGDFYVVFRPEAVMLAATGITHFIQTVEDAPTHRIGLLRGESSLPVEPSLLTSDGETQIGDTLYATRCSTRGIGCVTAFVAIPEALAAERFSSLIYMGFGALSGALLGFFITIFHRRSQGIELQLRRAVRDDRMKVLYQPIVDIASRRILGAEALIRWTDEDGFEVGPDVFVKVAEERGFGLEITRLVLRHALHDLGPALRSHPGFYFNINVTSTDLSDPRFITMLEQSLSQAGISARNVGIEITETGTTHQQSTIHAIVQLRRRGHRIYIDDFGTGYSSLAYLQDLSIDAIKIDRAFTKAVGTGAVTVSILPQIVAMAEALNLEIIVEGIETREQADYFVSVHKNIHAQGWLFGYPFPAEEFNKVLDAAQSAVTGSDPVA
jgi:sensor c-di-GMP phosphodiesterase-like protein